MTLTATAPKTPTMTVEAAAKADTRQQAANDYQVQAKTGSPPGTSTSAQQLQWFMLALQTAILAVFILSCSLCYLPFTPVMAERLDFFAYS